MAEAMFGIDTFENHLDLLRFDPVLSDTPTFKQSESYLDFKIWNGGVEVPTFPPNPRRVEGGDPLFAGRNFLGGDFLWGHAEATDALINPSPKDFSKLQLIVPRIAPIQAPQPNRQQVPGELGLLYGQIDAMAICKRVFSSILAGEFKFSSALNFVTIWLAVDPDVNLSVEYWVGWSDTVNKFSAKNLRESVQGPVSPPDLPFRSGILCKYVNDPKTNKLTRDPHVTITLATLAVKKAVSFPFFDWADTTCYSFWADTTNPDSVLVDPRPILPWDLFDTNEKPLPSLWRIAYGIQKKDGTPIVEFGIDAINPLIGGVESMLKTQQWQPSIPSSGISLGFLVLINIKDNNGKLIRGAISDQEIKKINETPFPEMDESSGEKDPSRRYKVPGGPVRVIGRYLKDKASDVSLKVDEAKRLSAADFRIFTCWQHFLKDPTDQPTRLGYFDPALKKGTRDGSDAFRYCAQVLHQPPHTPVFFAVDNFCPADSDGHRGLSLRQVRDWFRQYFQQVRDARDKYAEEDPDHYYLIGVYACGELLKWCYEDGIVSAFWLSLASGHVGSGFPSRPWPHANRFQYRGTGKDLPPLPWKVISGADPDMDWGDGGTWSLRDPLTQKLYEFEQHTLRIPSSIWGNLLDLSGDAP